MQISGRARKTRSKFYGTDAQPKPARKGAIGGGRVGFFAYPWERDQLKGG
jgi:hypothetical protein